MPYLLHNSVKCHPYGKISIFNSIKGHWFKTKERACLLLWGITSLGTTVALGALIQQFEGRLSLHNDVTRHAYITTHTSAKSTIL